MEDYRLDNGSVMTGEELFILLLRCFPYPGRMVDLEYTRWGARDNTQLGRGFWMLVNDLYIKHSDLLFDNLNFFAPRFPAYNQAIVDSIRRNGYPVPPRAANVVGFGDATILAVSRPTTLDGDVNTQK